MTRKSRKNKIKGGSKTFDLLTKALPSVPVYPIFHKVSIPNIPYINPKLSEEEKREKAKYNELGIDRYLWQYPNSVIPLFDEFYKKGKTKDIVEKYKELLKNYLQTLEKDINRETENIESQKKTLMDQYGIDSAKSIADNQESNKNWRYGLSGLASFFSGLFSFIVGLGENVGTSFMKVFTKNSPWILGAIFLIVIILIIVGASVSYSNQAEKDKLNYDLMQQSEISTDPTISKLSLQDYDYSYSRFIDIFTNFSIMEYISEGMTYMQYNPYEGSTRRPVYTLGRWDNKQYYDLSKFTFAQEFGKTDNKKIYSIIKPKDIPLDNKTYENNDLQYLPENIKKIIMEMGTLTFKWTPVQVPKSSGSEVNDIKYELNCNPRDTNNTEINMLEKDSNNPNQCKFIKTDFVLNKDTCTEPPTKTPNYYDKSIQRHKHVEKVDNFASCISTYS
jgi:hypothetical protein